MAETPISATQKRLLDLLQKECDGTYSHAARLLEEMGLPGNACPTGLNWRSVKKLSDEEYLAKFELDKINKNVEVETTKEKREREYLESKERERAYKQAKSERRQLNNALYNNGFRWQKVDEESIDHLAGWSNLEHLHGWYLLDPEGNEISLEEAKKQIGWVK